MQVKRTSAVALLIAAAVTPVASARVAIEPDIGSVKQHRVQGPQGGSRLAEMAAHREAISTRQWQLANDAPVRTLVRADAEGFDWTSAAIGATVPLALLLLDLFARRAVGRRRSRLAGMAS
jgi:hypothetical protein